MLKTCINQTALESGQKSMKFSFYFGRTKSVSTFSSRDRGCTVTLQDQQPHSLTLAGPAIAGLWKPLPSLRLPQKWWQSLSLLNQCHSHQRSGVAQPLLRRKNPCWHTFCFEAEDYFWMPQSWLTSLSSNPQPQDSVPFTLLLQFYFFK